MTTDTANVLVGEEWRDALEAGVRGRIRGFFEELLEEELTAALGRARPSGCRATPANQLRANRLLGMCCCRAEGLADCAQHGRGETKIDDAPGRYGLI